LAEQRVEQPTTPKKNSIKKKPKLHQTPNPVSTSKDFNYSVNYTDSLTQMAANLNVYSVLADLK
jgi:hypothetical protein